MYENKKYFAVLLYISLHRRLNVWDAECFVPYIQLSIYTRIYTILYRARIQSVWFVGWLVGRSVQECVYVVRFFPFATELS